LASPPGVDQLMTIARATSACLVLLLATTLGLRLMGRPWICTCGRIDLWHGNPNGPETSQHLVDWYSLTHIVHGFLFYAAAWLVGRLRGRAFSLGGGLLLAFLVECAWELAENTPSVVARYRAETIALGYEGDSIVNSASDILAMALGFAAAATLPVAVVITAAVAMEVALAWLIRDNLTLNVLMLLHPVESIKAWQAGR
jgi:hypothetical protein